MFAPITLLAMALQGAGPAAVTSVAPPPAPAAIVAAPRTHMPASRIRLARADSLLFAGDMNAAQSLYRSLANRETDAGRYAKQPLWDLAMSYRLAGEPVNMVRTLDDLASAARRFGDPETELVASYETARYYAAMRQSVVSRDRMARVRSLLQSPVIPTAIKADYTARLRTEN